MGNLLRALQAHGVAWRKASPFALKCRGVFPGVSSPSRQVSGEYFWANVFPVPHYYYFGVSNLRVASLLVPSRCLPFCIPEHS